MSLPIPHVEAVLDKDSETFSYVVYDAPNGHAVIIDPVLDFDYKSGRTASTTADKLLAIVEHLKLKVEWILETHAHADHLTAAPYLRDKLGAKIGIGEHIKTVQQVFKDIFNLEKEFLPNGAEFDHLFKDGEQFKVGSMSFRVIHTPGHTPADLAYLVNDRAAFVGDTMFMPDVGTARCDFPGGSASTLFDSIQKLLSLPADTQIFICHDYPPAERDYRYQTSVEEQRQHNIHVHQGVDKGTFIAKREARDKTLAMPRLILPSIQVNIRAGKMPPAEADGNVYLKIPLNKL